MSTSERAVLTWLESDVFYTGPYFSNSNDITNKTLSRSVQGKKELNSNQHGGTLPACMHTGMPIASLIGLAYGLAATPSGIACTGGT